MIGYDRDGPVVVVTIDRPARRNAVDAATAAALADAFRRFDADDTAAAMGFEFDRGMATIASGETVAGADRFAGGEGRHGAFDAPVS